MVIFAIDDEIASLGLLEETIRSCLPNEELYAFDSVKKMLLKAETVVPDVVFTDIEMPGIDGIMLSKKIQMINKNVNIIFVTGYSRYVLDAMKIYASDYIVKPVTTESVMKAMKNLRYPIESPKDIVIKTFGNFAVFYKGEPVKFRLEKSKELLAYLVDREGSPVSRREVASILYEDGAFDRNEQKYLSRIACWLKTDLEKIGINNLFINNDGKYSVDISLFDCDLIDYTSGKKDLFIGEYMEQYSWGEMKKSLLY